jgi:hypothetical protein
MCALIRLSYNRLIATYRYCPFQAHGLNAYKVHVVIPFDATAPF